METCFEMRPLLHTPAKDGRLRALMDIGKGPDGTEVPPQGERERAASTGGNEPGGLVTVTEGVSKLNEYEVAVGD